MSAFLHSDGFAVFMGLFGVFALLAFLDWLTKDRFEP